MSSMAMNRTFGFAGSAAAAGAATATAADITISDRIMLPSPSPRRGVEYPGSKPRSVHDVPQGLAEQRPPARLGPLHPHVEEAFLGVERRVRVDDEPVVT